MHDQPDSAEQIAMKQDVDRIVGNFFNPNNLGLLLCSQIVLYLQYQIMGIEITGDLVSKDASITLEVLRKEDPELAERIFHCGDPYPKDAIGKRRAVLQIMVELNQKLDDMKNNATNESA